MRTIPMDPKAAKPTTMASKRRQGALAREAAKFMDKKKNTLKDEALEVLRKKNRELIADLKKTKGNLVKAEKALMKTDIELKAASRAWVALFSGVMSLAEAVSNTTRAGRNAREMARRALEREGIRPPSVLGASRRRAPSKKRGKKKS